MTAYEFILKMKNYASSEIRKISDDLGVTKTKADQANTALSGIGKTGLSLKGIFTTLTATLGMLGIGLGFMKFNSMLTEGIEKADAMDKAVAQVKAGLESTGGAAGVSFDQLDASAKKFSKNVAYGRTEIYDMQAQMLTFGGVTKANFDKISQATMDVAARTKTDLHSMSIMMGKAMDNPAEGLKKLSRQGVMFSAAQAAAIEKLVKKGKTVEAQQIMLTEINNKYGGSAKAAFDADPLSGYNKAIGGLKVELGNAAIKLQSELAPAFMWLMGVMGAVFKKVPVFVGYLVELTKWVIGNKPLLIGLGVVIAGLGIQFLIANGAAIAMSIGMGILNGAIWLVSAATAAWNLIMSMNPISLVIIAIGALIVIIAALWNKFGWLRGSVLGVWEVLKGLGSMIKNYVINRVQELLSGITGIGAALVAFMKGDFSNAIEIGKKAGANLLGMGSKDKLIKDGVDAFKSFNKGWEEGMKPVATPKKAGAKADGKKTGGVLDKLYDPNADGDKDKDKDKKEKKKKPDSIVSGGSKQTQINITIGKLQDKTEIHVSNSEKGVSDLGDKVQEMLLRAVNSVNQMQTA